MTIDYTIKWQPGHERVAATALHTFMEDAGGFKDYAALHAWSVAEKENFWSRVWDFCDVAGDKGARVFAKGDTFAQSRFFPDAKLNFAENLLRRRDDGVAIVFRGEGQEDCSLTFKALYDLVSQTRQALRDAGVEPGDRVAGYMPNMPETIIAMLATASLGAVWSSASPDFGVKGVLDRFGQIEPKVLFAVNGYFYNGKTIDCRDKVAEITAGLPSLVKTVVVPYAFPAPEDGTSFGDFTGDFEPQYIDFERFSFDHPLYIMFSSGTTGVPKCIVHGAGGTLLQHVKEHRLHCDIRRDDKVFYFTTCGWMMWNWLVSALAMEATLLLYDGAPLYPDGYALFQFAEKYRCTLFGTSAKYIDAIRTAGVRLDPNGYDLDCIRLVASTGSPLSPEGFDYMYESVLPNAQLASISGGTDIISCFVLGNPISSVYRGEIQGPGLGMDIDVFDENEKPLRGEKGELVCKTPFPSMPTGFWNDADGARYHAAYFERFPGIWCHGDWCAWTENGGMVIHGRSDATLNPGGVRIGTAEIYRIVEQLPEIKESIAVGQEWEGDVRVVLFVVLAKDAVLDDALRDKIKKAVRAGATPRHVPARIAAVTDIPRTKSGKITELAVREVIHGRPVKNTEALANPEALAFYKDVAEIGG
ncbi:MAG: acetoacetate--CoA ligase [Alphaproteobacteria bacterium]|nr:acetoacetate--CoA ligase [Alphaproteobacteria bacterium]